MLPRSRRGDFVCLPLAVDFLQNITMYKRWRMKYGYEREKGITDSVSWSTTVMDLLHLY